VDGGHGEQLILRDGNNNARIIMHAHYKVPYIEIRGTDGAQLHLCVAENSPSIQLRRKGGGEALLAASSETGAVVLIGRSDGRSMVRIEADIESERVTAFCIDANGRCREVQLSRGRDHDGQSNDLAP